VTGGSTVRLDLAYDGTGFRGWARQRDASIRTVEGELTGVIERVVQERVKLSVAGRTDAGVHARGQVASFATTARIDPERIRDAVNGTLGPEVVVRRATRAPAGFDARFSATARIYRYVIDTAEVPDPFIGRYAWHRPGALVLTPMRAAGRALRGHHDFAAFCRHPGGDRSTVRDLRSATVVRRGTLVVFGFEANAFLHQMVRSLVGTIVDVGAGRIDAREVSRILGGRDRSAARSVAPPHGLTLERVVYGRGGRVPAPSGPPGAP
jgi:tRNA pseudouridine38-40 synthase